MKILILFLNFGFSSISDVPAVYPICLTIAKVLDIIVQNVVIIWVPKSSEERKAGGSLVTGEVLGKYKKIGKMKNKNEFSNQNLCYCFYF